MQKNQIELNLYNSTVTLPPGKVIANEIKKKFDQIALSEASKFRESFFKQFSNLDDLYQNCDHVVNQVRLRAIDEGMKFITAHGVYDLSEQRFFEQFLQTHDSWVDDFDVVGRQYESILEQTAELDAYRTARRKNRRMWVGYTEAAVSKADGYNWASNIGHGAFNLVAKGITSVANSIKKDEIFKKSSTIDHLVVAVYQLVIAVSHATTDAINSRFDNLVHDYSDDEVSRAKAIVENVQKGRIPAEGRQAALIKALDFYPYNKDIYEILLINFGDKNASLELTAEYFGVTGVLKRKKELFEVELKKHDLSTLAAYNRNSPKLSEYADFIGYNGFAPLAAQIKKTVVVKDFKEKLAKTDLTTLQACHENIPTLKRYAKEIDYEGFDQEIPGILNASIDETFRQETLKHDFSSLEKSKESIEKLEVYAKEIGYKNFQLWANKVRVDAFDQDIREQFKSTAPVYNQVENDSSIQKSDSGGAKIFWIVLVSVVFVFGGLFFLFLNQKHKETQAVESARLTEVQRFSVGSTDKDRYQILAQGAEVKDTNTGLVWQRCSVGQAWTGGTCSGSAKEFNFSQAQALAGGGWRVPNKDELISLVVRQRHADLAIDAEAFPATPSWSFWTSTPDADDSNYAWHVNFYDRNASSSYLYLKLHVRLVR
jgi:hypothetical protein